MFICLSRPVPTKILPPRKLLSTHLINRCIGEWAQATVNHAKVMVRQHKWPPNVTQILIESEIKANNLVSIQHQDQAFREVTIESCNKHCSTNHLKNNCQPQLWTAYPLHLFRNYSHFLTRNLDDWRRKIFWQWRWTWLEHRSLKVLPSILHWVLCWACSIWCYLPGLHRGENWLCLV